MVLDVYTNTQNNVIQQANMSSMENLEVNGIFRANNTDFIMPDQENKTTDSFSHGGVSHTHNLLDL